MKKKNLLFVALASVMLATSCAEDVEYSRTMSNSEIMLHPNVRDVVSRASETTTSNLSDFVTYTFLDGTSDNYMDDVIYTRNGENWTTKQGTFYWPASENLYFYCYAPSTANGTAYVSGVGSRCLSFFSPKINPDDQEDLIYAKAVGNLENNGSTGITLNFNHALSEIIVMAKNENNAYTIEVTGVEIGNVVSSGNLNFGDINGDANWTLHGNTADYSKEWNQPYRLNAYASYMGDNDVPFMLIPQQLTEKDNVSKGNYIAVKAKITMQGGTVIYDGWVYIGINTTWEMGNCYIYTIDFTTGIGTDPYGNAYISNKRASYAVNVKEWNNITDALPRFYVKGQNYVKSADEFSATIDGNKIGVTTASDGSWKFEVTGMHPSSLNNFLSSNNSIASLNLNGMDVSETTDFSYAFSHCGFYSLNVSRWDTSKAANTVNMFSTLGNCTSLNLSGWDTSNITDMRYMFQYCTTLTTLDLSGWKINQDAKTNFMFDHDTSLKTIYMVGCDDATINKIKTALTDAGLSTDIVKTTR